MIVDIKEKPLTLFAAGLCVGFTLLPVISYVKLNVKKHMRRKRLEKQPIKLGYWKIRGMAQPIRLMLEYTKTPYEDVLYEQGDADTNFSRETWLKQKRENPDKLTFPNLPYVLDDSKGDTLTNRMVQSGCILRSIARENNLLGKSTFEMEEVDMLYYEIADFKSSFTQLCYGQYNDEEKRNNYIDNTLPMWLGKFNQYLSDKRRRDGHKHFIPGEGTHQTWLVGKDVTLADFVLYEAVDCSRIMANHCLNSFPLLSDFMTQFEKLEQINKYLKSNRYFNRPLNNKIAQFK